MATEWQYRRIDEFTGGLNAQTRSDVLEDNEIVSVSNLIPRTNSLSLPKGYNSMTVPFSTGLVSDIKENVKLLYALQIAAGSTTLLTFTDLAVYSYDGANWIQLKTADSEVNTFDHTGELLLDAGHTLSNGDTLKLVTSGTLPAGLSSSVVYYVVNINATVDFQIALTSGGSAITFSDNGSGTHTYIPTFNGITTLPLKADTYTPSDAVIWTNGIDPVQIYEASTNEVRPLSGLTSGAPKGVSAAVTTCREVAVWDTRIFLFYTTEDGVDLPQQIRWSDVGNIEDFTGTGTSDAGFERLSDKEDGILSAIILAEDLIIYRDNSIVRGSVVGTSVRTFDFDEVISSEGAFGPNAVTSTLDGHVFVGNNNIYAYRGGQSLDPIGDKIYPLVFGSSGLLDFSKSTFVVAKHLTSLRQLWFCLWVGTTVDGNGDFTAYKTTTLVFDLEKSSWGIRLFGSDSVDIRIETILESAISSDPLWSDLDFAWEDAGNITWSSQAFSPSFPNILMGTTNQILNQDHVEGDDDSIAIPFNFETKDFITGARPARFEYVDIETDGGAAEVSYSTDRGVSYTVIGNTTIQTSPKISRIFFTTVTKQIRFKVAGAGGGIEIISMAFYLAEESEF